MKRTLILLLILALSLSACAEQEAAAPPVETIAPTATPLPPSPSPEPTPIPLLEPQLTDYIIDQSLFGPVDEAGEIFITEYETRDYNSQDPTPVKKQMGVYLPYGYDRDKQYDVLFLMHTSGADENFWLMQSLSYAHPDFGYIEVSVQTLLDNMIARGYCKPVIVMTPDGYLNDDARVIHNSAQVYSQFEQEFAGDILPFVAEHYATYATGSSREEISAAREHFGFMGASFGAYMAYLSIMPENFDLVANFALSGGGEINYDYLASAWQSAGTASLPMGCLYIGEGEYDDRAGPEGSYYALKNHTDVFTDENLFFTLYGATGHEPREWINSLYNSLQLFFR